MEIYLIRHGRTALNQRRAYCGRINAPITPEGAEEAHRIHYALTPTRVYVTPLLRTQQTAAILFPQAEQIIVEELREMNFGDFEGREADQLEQDPMYRAWLASNCQLPCPNGESLESFRQRIAQALYQLVAQVISQGDKELVIVAHGGTIMASMTTYAQPGQEYFQWHVDNCRGYRAQIDAATWEKAPALTQWQLLQE